MKYYDKVIITNLPAFYKVKLFNEISKSEKIYVIFTGNTESNRQKDFFSEPIMFEFISIAEKKLFSKYIFLLEMLCNISFKEFILGGWDETIFWIANFLIPKQKTSLIVESSDYESTKQGVKGLLKRIFLNRVGKVYASGISQVNLVRNLRYAENIVVTNGVGLFNVVDQPVYLEKKEVNKFLYVGRLSPEKNLEFIIKFFNKNPALELTIIGYGGEEERLKSFASSNIIFLGAIDNKELSIYYKKADVFILPSLNEVWGLVVEEALNNGLPVLVSDRVGCASSIVSNDVGRIFNLSEESSFASCVRELQDISLYNKLRKNISLLDFKKVEKKQVECYLVK